LLKDASNNGWPAINTTLPGETKTDPTWVLSEAVATMLLTVNGANAESPLARA
jgi:hypothetical protein